MAVAGDGELEGQTGTVGGSWYAGGNVIAGSTVEEDAVIAAVCDIADEDMAGKDAGYGLILDVVGPCRGIGVEEVLMLYPVMRLSTPESRRVDSHTRCWGSVLRQMLYAERLEEVRWARQQRRRPKKSRRRPSVRILKHGSEANVSPHGPAGVPEGPYGTTVDSHYFVG